MSTFVVRITILRGTTDFAPQYVPWKNTAVLGSTMVMNNSRQTLATDVVTSFHSFGIHYRTEHKIHK